MLALALALWVAQASLQDPEAARGIAVAPVEGTEVETSSATYGRRHALVVGIDAYEDPAYPDLGYAVADARAVAEILVGRYGFAQDDVLLILNEDATRDALAESLEEWACDPDRVGEEDLLVVSSRAMVSRARVGVEATATSCRSTVLRIATSRPGRACSGCGTSKTSPS